MSILSKKRKGQQSELLRRLIFAIVILALYAIGRRIPLPFVDVASYQNLQIGADFFLLNATGGYSSQYSLFALGIMPYIWGSLSVRVFDALANRNKKSIRSPKQLNRLTLTIALIIAIPLAIDSSRKLIILPAFSDLALVAFVLNTLLMVAGSAIIVFLAKSNQDRGIGGQALIIIVNVVDSLFLGSFGRQASMLFVALATGMVFAIIGLVMENKEHRIPVLRVSVHNVHAENNYLPIKWNPVGIMPLVFTPVLFVLPQALTNLVLLIDPDNSIALSVLANLDPSTPFGVIIYIVAIFVFQHLLIFAFLRIDDQVDSFLRTGDCIEGIHPGDATREYIKSQVNMVANISATVMCACFAIPHVVFPIVGISDPSLISLPIAMMLLACMSSNVVREFLSYWRTENYKEFL